MARLNFSAAAAASGVERAGHLEALATHHHKLQIWAQSCPDNFVDRAALVGAEIARIEDHDLDAMRLYEQAIRSARENGFVHIEAIAYEHASAFYRARGFDEFAEVYLRDARRRYLTWGADGKVRQLDRLYPQLRQEERAPAPTGTIDASLQQLDVATVISEFVPTHGKLFTAEDQMLPLLEERCRERREDEQRRPSPAESEHRQPDRGQRDDRHVGLPLIERR